MLERLGGVAAMKEFMAEFGHPMVLTRGPLIVGVNDAWLSVFGFDRESVEGRAYLEFMPPEERMRVRQRAALRAKAPEKIPFGRVTSLALKADGSSTLVHVQPTLVPMPDGDPFVINFLFVLPERDAEIELADLLVATSTCLARARTLREVRRLAVTRLAEAGYAAAFLRRDGTPIHPDETALPPSVNREALEEAIRQERAVFVGPDLEMPEAVVVPIQRGVESEILVMTGPRLSTPIRASLSLFAHSVGSALDTATLIADLERRNRELSDTRVELLRHERLAALGEMAASVAHEVRNPVGVISNAVSTLRRRTDGASESRQLLSIIDEECLRLARIVRDLLEFARHRPVAFTVEVLAEIAEEAISVASSQPDLAARGARFELEDDPSVPKVSVDRDLLRQALVNLLINAAQASDEPSVVRICVGVEQSEGVGPVASIAIVDSGCGISESIRGRIFDPFFTTRAQGSGLGLAVVRRVVETLRADISLDSAPGKGTTFRLSFRPDKARRSEVDALEFVER